jgi:CxxC motif-containing protein
MRHEMLICILCPNSCELDAEIDETDGIKVLSVRGFLCPRGKRWAVGEIENPVRVATTSVLCNNGMLPLVSVKTDRAVPRGMMENLMKEISRCSVDAPVSIGDAVLVNPAGIECIVVATRNIKEREIQ